MSLGKDDERFNERQALNLSFGQDGVTRIYNTTTAINATDNGYSHYLAVQCLSACKFTTLDEDSASGSSHDATMEVPAGVVLYGMFTKIQLASTGMYARAYGTTRLNTD